MAVLLLVVFVICAVLDNVFASAFGTRMNGDGDYHGVPPSGFSARLLPLEGPSVKS